MARQRKTIDLTGAVHVSARNLGAVLGVSHAYARQLAEGTRGSSTMSTFPAPVVRVKTTTDRTPAYWDLDEVIAWGKENELAEGRKRRPKGFAEKTKTAAKAKPEKVEHVDREKTLKAAAAQAVVYVEGNTAPAPKKRLSRPELRARAEAKAREAAAAAAKGGRL